MPRSASFIGFGEAGQALVWACARAFDRKTLDDSTRADKWADYDAAGIEGCESAEEALRGGFLVFSLVTADQALAAARAYGPMLMPGAFWFDFNSVAPETKRLAAAAIGSSGAKYIDVAVMAPVLPSRRDVPLLLSGSDAPDAAALLDVLGFTNVSVVGRAVGEASAIKMIRSVMVKGIEALTLECLLAASRAGVAELVLASLQSSWKEQLWEERADYNIERMLAHGLRRAAEMEEAARTLEELGIDPAITRGTIARQRQLGALGIDPPAGLAAKLAAIDPDHEEKAA